MTDDLKSRLRKLEGGDKYGSTVWYRNPDGPEAADRIEKLEKNVEDWQRMYREAVIQKEMIFRHQYDRIEKLEAALSDIIVLSDDYSKAVPIARKALEGKDD